MEAMNFVSDHGLNQTMSVLSVVVISVHHGVPKWNYELNLKFEYTINYNEITGQMVCTSYCLVLASYSHFISNL